jgi:hypothetical protein
MTSIRRLRALAGLLTESVADDPMTNQRIEAALTPFPHDTQIAMLDALEVIKMAGAEGLTATEWANKVRDIYQDPEMPLTDMFKALVRAFPFVVKRTLNGKWGWIVSSPDMTNDEMAADPYRDLIGMQIDMTSTALAFMRQKGEFTLPELVRAFTERGLPAQMAMMQAQHVVQTFSHMLEMLPAGKYRFKGDEDRQTTAQSLAFLRDLAIQAAQKRDSGVE